MDRQTSYVVEPATVSLFVDVDKGTMSKYSGINGFLAFLLWITICVISAFLFAAFFYSFNPSWSKGPLSFFWLVLSIIVPSYSVNFLSNLKRKERAIEALTEKDRKTKLSEAIEVTDSLMKILESSLELKYRLNESRSEVNSALTSAIFEFKETAFGPFWDAVENAVQSLNVFRYCTDSLSNNHKKYYSLLNGRRHNFPPFPVMIDSIPDITPTLSEFRRIVRMGQTNFQFATIWEQRKTREVLIAGFQTLGEAVNNIGTVIESEIKNLKENMTTNIVNLTEEVNETRRTIDLHGDEQAKTLDEQTKMLDNIQRGRKPN